MSVKLVDWALDRPVTPSGRKFVLVCIAEACGPHGHGFPGQGYIAKRTSQAVSTVRDHLKALEAEGWIKRTHRYRKNGERTSDAFQINPHRAPLVGYEAPAEQDDEPWPEGAADGAEQDGRPQDLPPDSGGSLAPDSGASATAEKPEDYRQISEGLAPDSGGYSIEPSENQVENQTRARDGAAADGAAPPRASGETNSDPAGGDPGGQDAPAETVEEVAQRTATAEAREHWQARQEAIMAALAEREGSQAAGQRVYATWLKELFCIRGDGERLLLAATSTLIAETVQERFGNLLEVATGRRIKVVFRIFTHEASKRSSAAGKATAKDRGGQAA